MRWSFLLWIAALASPVACSVDPSLDYGDAAPDTSAPPDGAPPTDAGSDTTVKSDASLDAAADATVDASSDAPKDVLTTDGPCTATCPSGTTCNGSFCSVPQGTACSSAVSTAGGTGALDGTVCANSGPSITTTCTSPMTASATFVHFTSGGDPWNVTIKAVNGPLQIETLSACGTGIACYDLANGQSTTIVVNQNTILAIVNGSNCTDWQITYVSK